MRVEMKQNKGPGKKIEVIVVGDGHGGPAPSLGNGLKGVKSLEDMRSGLPEGPVSASQPDSMQGTSPEINKDNDPHGFREASKSILKRIDREIDRVFSEIKSQIEALSEEERKKMDPTQLGERFDAIRTEGLNRDDLSEIDKKIEIIKKVKIPKLLPEKNKKTEVKKPAKTPSPFMVKKNIRGTYDLSARKAYIDDSFDGRSARIEALLEDFDSNSKKPSEVGKEIEKMGPLEIHLDNLGEDDRKEAEKYLNEKNLILKKKKADALNKIFGKGKKEVSQKEESSSTEIAKEDFSDSGTEKPEPGDINAAFNKIFRDFDLEGFSEEEVRYIEKTKKRYKDLWLRMLDDLEESFIIYVDKDDAGSVTKDNYEFAIRRFCSDQKNLHKISSESPKGKTSIRKIIKKIANPEIDIMSTATGTGKKRGRPAKNKIEEPVQGEAEGQVVEIEASQIEGVHPPQELSLEYLFKTRLNLEGSIEFLDEIDPVLVEKLKAELLEINSQIQNKAESGQEKVVLDDQQKLVGDMEETIKFVSLQNPDSPMINHLKDERSRVAGEDVGFGENDVNIPKQPDLESEAAYNLETAEPAEDSREKLEVAKSPSDTIQPEEQKTSIVEKSESEEVVRDDKNEIAKINVEEKREYTQEEKRKALEEAKKRVSLAMKEYSEEIANKKQQYEQIWGFLDKGKEVDLGEDPDLGHYRSRLNDEEEALADVLEEEAASEGSSSEEIEVLKRIVAAEQQAELSLETSRAMAEKMNLELPEENKRKSLFEKARLYAKTIGIGGLVLAALSKSDLSALDEKKLASAEFGKNIENSLEVNERGQTVDASAAVSVVAEKGDEFLNSMESDGGQENISYLEDEKNFFKAMKERGDEQYMDFRDNFLVTTSNINRSLFRNNPELMGRTKKANLSMQADGIMMELDEEGRVVMQHLIRQFPPMKDMTMEQWVRMVARKEVVGEIE